MRASRVATLLCGLCTCAALGAQPVVIGGKIFTESYVLGEIAAQRIEATQATVSRKLGLGSTGILFEALQSGAVDVYPDYTGTLAEALLKRPELRSVGDIRQALSAMGLTISDAVRLLLTRIATEKRLPFAPLVPNAETIAAIKECRRGKLTKADSVSDFMHAMHARD